jgi:hypothetical protein
MYAGVNCPTSGNNWLENSSRINQVNGYYLRLVTSNFNLKKFSFSIRRGSKINSSNDWDELLNQVRLGGLLQASKYPSRFKFKLCQSLRP